MNRLRNPFTPGAGYQPPELAGRNQVLEDGFVVAVRTKELRAERGLMLIGPRGVGKTVLLKCLASKAREAGVIPLIAEVRNDRSDLEELVGKIRDVLCELDFRCKVKAVAREAFAILSNFVGKFSIEIGSVGVSVEPRPGLGESGNLELDLSNVLLALSKTAKEAGTAVGLYMDELQNLDEGAMRGIVVALHRAAQEMLPIYLIGSGLPTIRALVGKCKTYAERMFVYEDIGALDEDASWAAVVKPFEDNGVSVDEEAFGEIFKVSCGYPFFLQECGYQIWQQIEDPAVRAADVRTILPIVRNRLDDSFFAVRFDRVSAVERKFLLAMSQGDAAGPQDVAVVAARMGRTSNGVSMLRRSLLRKGMIYAPSLGKVAYTVPMFGDYIQRIVGNPRVYPFFLNES